MCRSTRRASSTSRSKFWPRVAGAAVDDARHPLLRGRVHLVGHQVEVGGERRLRVLESGQPGGARVADGQVLVEQRLPARELVGRDVAKHGADDGAVGECHPAGLAPAPRRRQADCQARCGDDPDAGGAEPAQGATACHGHGRVRVHGHGCSPGNGWNFAGGCASSRGRAVPRHGCGTTSPRRTTPPADADGPGSSLSRSSSACRPRCACWQSRQLPVAFLLSRP